MKTSPVTPTLTQRAVSWDDANLLRDSYNNGNHERIETDVYAWGGSEFMNGEHWLTLIEVADNSVWYLPLDRESNVLTAKTPSIK